MASSPFTPPLRALKLKDYSFLLKMHRLSSKSKGHKALVNLCVGFWLLCVPKGKSARRTFLGFGRNSGRPAPSWSSLGMALIFMLLILWVAGFALSLLFEMTYKHNLPLINLIVASAVAGVVSNRYIVGSRYMTYCNFPKSARDIDGSSLPSGLSNA